MAPTGPMVHANQDARSLATQRFVPMLLEQLPPAGIERRRRRIDGHSQPSTASKYLA